MTESGALPCSAGALARVLELATLIAEPENPPRDRHSS
jgi:hypothetical protein